MDNIINLLTNTTVSLAVIAYFMLRDWKFMDTMQKTLQSLNESVELIEKYFIGEKGDK